jgi:exopolysaccharide biosynthesis WecB/TagA/CpsF family protein
VIAPERTISVLGVPLVRLSPRAALAEAERLYDEPEPAYIAHANVHTLNLAGADLSYRRALEGAAMVLNDGKGVMLAARLKGDRFPADLNGNFFTPLLLELAAERDWPVFFLGAKPGVAERALEVITRRLPHLRAVGVRDGYFAPGDDSVAGRVRALQTGLCLVGLGNPAQELWMQANLAATGARLAVGVGAFFDFQAGQVPRAPEWMNRAGIEWIHRLAKEPRRMWRRYLLGNPAFLARVMAEELARR